MPDVKTEEQEAILEFAKREEGNFQINALAGTGKTTTLEMIQTVCKEKPVLCLAFNKRAQEDMEKRMLSTTTVRTFNSLGHRIWAKTTGHKLSVDGRKCQEILREHIKTMKGAIRDECWEVYWPTLEGVALAKALGYVPQGSFLHAKRLITLEDFYPRLEENPGGLTKTLIDYVLRVSIQTAYNGWVDFNDQVYMPSLFGGTFPRFPLVLVDEAQDLNPVNHQMLEKLCKGRIGTVGDRWQSIYAFRGAVVEGMDAIRDKFECHEFDLSVSFRCPKAVVLAARWRVPNLKWKKEGGRVERLQSLHPANIPEEATILCRNNAPLFRTALGLLMAGRSVSVSGSEVGPKLIRLLEKICDDDDNQATMARKIRDWEEERLAKSNAHERIKDEADCLRVFATFGQTQTQAVAYVRHMFDQQGPIKLMTGHKAKGGEWPCVYHLDPWMCNQEEQDLNLRYVITTRSEDTLFEIDSRNMKW